MTGGDQSRYGIGVLMYLTIPACLFLFMASISSPIHRPTKIKKYKKSVKPKAEGLREALLDKDPENFPE